MGHHAMERHLNGQASSAARMPISCGFVPKIYDVLCLSSRDLHSGHLGHGHEPLHWRIRQHRRFLSVDSWLEDTQDCSGHGFETIFHKDATEPCRMSGFAS
jgi:hypothetical protein